MRTDTTSRTIPAQHAGDIKPGTVTLTIAQFLSVASVATCAATDGVTPVINAVRLTREGSHVWAIATDRYRVGMVSFEISSAHSSPEDGNEFDFDVLVPESLLRKLVSTVKASKAREVTVFVTDSGLVEFCYGGSTSAMSGINGTFPPIERLIPEISDEPVTLGSTNWSADLLAALTKILDPATGKKFDHWTQQLTIAATGKPGPALWHAGPARFLIQPRLKLR